MKFLNISIRRRESKHKNLKAFEYLMDLGFPVQNIRKCFPKLIGASHKDIGKKIQMPEQVVSNVISGQIKRPAEQTLIASVYHVPKEILFDDIRAKTYRADRAGD